MIIELRKIAALLYKDLLVLFRDRAGLMIMFFMPAALVVAITYIQDNTFKSVLELDVPVVLLNKDEGQFGLSVRQKIEESIFFNVTVLDNKSEVSSLKDDVWSGKYMIGIVIPENFTKSLSDNSTKVISRLFGGQSLTDLEVLDIEIYADPSIRDSLVNAVVSLLREYSTKFQMEFVFSRIHAQMFNFRAITSSMGGTTAPNIDEFDFVNINKRIITKGGIETDPPNSVQHNVPAWTVFAIFFIVVSFSASLIKERDEGSFVRLRTIAFPSYYYILSKAAIYLFVCILQFLLILCVGVWVFSLIGLSSFEYVGKLMPLLFVVVCTAIAAIGYAALVGGVASTHHQATVFGAVSIVILSAIGGVWVPVFAMPEICRIISGWSPLNWGLQAFYDVILRNCNVSEILLHCYKLTGFGVVTMVIGSVYGFRKSPLSQ
ncbi:MAG: ABC transporter permease [Holophagaceae bacterium]|nr:ABC transporter permease [Holophagaceae bacterium]